MRLISRLFLTLGATLSLDASALEQKDLKDVDISEMTRETQKTIHTEGVHLVWWIPPEYWAASIKDDASMYVGASQGAHGRHGKVLDARHRAGGSHAIRQLLVL